MAILVHQEVSTPLGFGMFHCVNFEGLACARASLKRTIGESMGSDEMN